MASGDKGVITFSITRGDSGGEKGLLKSSGIMVMLDTLTADCMDCMEGSGDSALLQIISSITDPTDPGWENTDPVAEGDVTGVTVEFTDPGDCRLLQLDCTDPGWENVPELLNTMGSDTDPGAENTTPFGSLTLCGDGAELGDIKANGCGDIPAITEPVGENTELPGDVTDPDGDLSFGAFIIASAYGFRRSINFSFGPDTVKLRFFSSAFNSATFISSKQVYCLSCPVVDTAGVCFFTILLVFIGVMFGFSCG